MLEWKSMFKAIWKTFETDLGPILTSLASRRTLLESEKLSASLYEINKVRERIDSVYQEQQKEAKLRNDERHRTNMREVRLKLQSPDYQTNQEMSTENRSGSQTGQWIFNHPKFKTWYDCSISGNTILYINGIPGAGMAIDLTQAQRLSCKIGKTTLISTVIEMLLREKRSMGCENTVVYFYFKHTQNRAHNGLLRAVLEQLISQNMALSDQFFHDISSLEGEDLRKTEKLQGLIERALEACRVLYLVFDGLDECPRDEAMKTVKWLLHLVSKDFQETNLRLIISSQRDGAVDKLLKPYPSISLDKSETPAHTEDIERYCEEFCGRIEEEFGLTREIRNEILSEVLNSTNGMFLYARVVLDNLINQATLSDLKKEISPETFPRGIEDAYVLEILLKF
ncbi:hypothetical protein IL306_012717 [Fusarium sp. DS 682]|nr:hypothetical protein IL306_012717 [Fusarium sp. DS 682]